MKSKKWLSNLIMYFSEKRYLISIINKQERILKTYRRKTKSKLSILEQNEVYYISDPSATEEHLEIIRSEVDQVFQSMNYSSPKIIYTNVEITKKC